ncbi:hypothetical protein EZ313_20380 [Ramlibacter henchirensis]|uniref:Uncharacterized protein n=1 Tax=Ramlibacter henchirensis TaxID=204072 RepID=A0A4Z0BPV5_9BURK|nr:hypothetical protein [Ramlibacter henchirensis]TFZ00802.1 hypothetical protein EZ313_20380 [Ramlibacter henchirensis]
MQALQTHPWAYPALEIVHIFGIALLLGNLVLLELRVFGRGAALPLADLARLSLTVALCGFTLVAASGLLMFASQPQELLANSAFTLKMLLILLAGGNAVAFHVRGSLKRLDTTARALMLVSTVLWLAVLTCGRWIAYR